LGDQDTILLKVNPKGLPATGAPTITCFDDDTPFAPQPAAKRPFLAKLEQALIQERKTNPQEKSYEIHLFSRAEIAESRGGGGGSDRRRGRKQRALTGRSR